MQEREREARRLTQLFESHSKFSFVRLGDMDLGMLLALQDGVDDPFALREVEVINGTIPFGNPGVGMTHAQRILEAFREADYVDFHQRLWPVGALLPRLKLSRRSDGYSNPTIETSYLLLTWVEKEFSEYCSRHRVGFAGAEATLLECLLLDPQFIQSGHGYWSAEIGYQFHQVRNDGRTLDKDLDEIKKDLREFIVRSEIDTLFLSLGGGAKILCHELARECNIRAIDFGAMLRGLTYSGSDGQSATRATHSPFYFRVPFETYMSALKRAFKGMLPEIMLAKAHAQLLRELQPCIVGWTSSVSEENGCGYDIQNFRESYSAYLRTCRMLFDANSACRKERRNFLHYCGKRKLTWEGKTFYSMFVAKDRCRRLLKKLEF